MWPSSPLPRYLPTSPSASLAADEGCPSHTCQSRPCCVSRTETCTLLAHYAIFLWSFARRRSRSTPRSISGSSNRRLRRSGLCEGRMAFRVPGRRGSISDVGLHAISPIPPTATECMRSNEMSLRANRVLMHCNRRCPRCARGVGHLVCGCGNCQIDHNHCDRGRQTPETCNGDDETPHVRGSVRCRRDDAYAHCARWLGAESALSRSSHQKLGSDLQQIPPLQRQYRAARDRHALVRRAGVVRRRTLSDLERHPQQHPDAMG